MQTVTAPKTPCVSYIVTVYNKAPYLPFMLEGLRRQEGVFEREFLFIDDGSTDRSLAVLRHLTAGWDNVTIVEQQNSGPAAATNRLIEMASADYIKLVDADDVLMPWATQVLLDAISDTGCDVAYSFFRRALPYDQNGAISPADLVGSHGRQPGRVTVDPEGLYRSLDGSLTTPASWLGRTDIVKATGGCDPNIFVQDYSIELRLALRTRFAEVHEPIFWMPESLSGRIMESMAQLFHDCNMALGGLLRDEPGLSKKVKQHALRRAVNRAWGWARRHGRNGPLSRDRRIFVAAKSGLVPASSETIFKTCEIFRETDNIRLPLRRAPLPSRPDGPDAA